MERLAGRAAAGLLALAGLLAAALPAAALNGTIVYTEGDVTLASGGTSHEAQIGDAIGAGDSIATGRGSLAVIDLANGTTLKLREKTTLAVDSLGDDTAVSLSAGGVFTSIAHKLAGSFTLKASTAVAGVRGTQFFVAYGRTIDARPDIWLCVNQGVVQVDLPDAGQSTLVKEGLGINIVAGARLTTPRRYPWTRKLNWNNDPASGRVKDTTNLDQAYADLLDQDYD
jgi:ferric-dicitrate binding protein FerR (iron transport regulator)